MAAIPVDVDARNEAAWRRFDSNEAAARGRGRRRLRYWLNSFRGFAVYDVRGADSR